MRLFHDLPLTREEYLSCFLLESDAAASAVASASSTEENEKISNDGAVADYYIDVIKVWTMLVAFIHCSKFDATKSYYHYYYYYYYHYHYHFSARAL